MGKLKLIRVLAILAAVGLGGCISLSGNSPPSSTTTCTTANDGTQTCTSKPTGGSNWHFFL